MNSPASSHKVPDNGRGLRNRAWFVPVMATDFLFWTTSTGLAPLLSRMVSASVPEEEAPPLISHMVLFFAMGTLSGRFLAGRWRGRPNSLLLLAVVLSGSAFSLYFLQHPTLWTLGQGLQGLALGIYGVCVVTLVSAYLPPTRQMRGFAQIGMADFLGVAAGPVLSGLIFSRWGTAAALATFLSLLVLALVSVSLIPSTKLEDTRDASMARVPRGAYLRFLPLTLSLWITILFHIFYSRYLPVLFEAGSLPVETLFFFGYVVGGIVFRLGLVHVLERIPGYLAFAAALGMMSLTALAVTAFSHIHQGFSAWVLLTGTCYGLGFEMLYIFCLSWTATHTRSGYRGRVFAFVFFGFDAGNLLAGMTFGHLATSLSPMGLFHWLLWLIPLYLSFPILVKKGKFDPVKA